MTFALQIPVKARVQAAGFLAIQLAWLILAGLSLRISLVTTLTTVFIGIWGYVVIKTVDGKPIRPQEQLLWVLGPGLGFGALVLFLIRLIVPESAFLAIFVIIPVLYTMLTAKRVLTAQSPREDSFIAPERVHWPLVVFGLVGVSLQRQWAWPLPLTMAAIISVALIHLVKPTNQLLRFAMFTPVIVAGWIVQNQRPESWWLSAERIPADESLFEAFANGLVKYGPTTNPIYQSLDGVEATAYHHLAYLTVGLVNRMTNSAHYEILMIAAPIYLRLSIVACCLLLLRRVVPQGVSTGKAAAPSLLGLLGCLAILKTGSANSDLLGVSSVISSFVLLGVAKTDALKWRTASLAGASVVVVSFSKGPLILATLIFALVLSVIDFKWRWKQGLAVLVAFVAVSAFFTQAASSVGSIKLEFWASRNMSSEFSFSFYNLKIFSNLLIVPVISGLAAALMLLATPRSNTRQWTLPLAGVLLAGIASQVLLTSSGPANYSYFYAPAIIATSLLVLVLGRSVQQNFTIGDKTFLAILLGSGALYWLIERELDPIDSNLASPLVAISTLCSVSFLALRTAKFNSRLYQKCREFALSSFLAMLLLASSIFSYSNEDFQQARNLSTINSERSWSNWYGDSDMAGLTQFVTRATTGSDLLVYSTCPLKSFIGDICEPDFRLAALTGRRFLVLDPWGFEEDVGSPYLGDMELSSSIGTESAEITAQSFIERGVSHMIINKSRVADDWIRSARSSEMEQLYENQSYVVFKLQTSGETS